MPRDLATQYESAWSSLAPEAEDRALRTITLGTMLMGFDLVLRHPPVQPQNTATPRSLQRALLNAAGHASAAVRALKSSLWATARGTGA